MTRSPADQRRASDRAKIRKVGRVVCSDTRKVVSCIILDLSDTGARLLVHEKVPDQIELFYKAERILRPALVIRRQNDTLGIRFEGEGQVLDGDDERLNDLLG